MSAKLALFNDRLASSIRQTRRDKEHKSLVDGTLNALLARFQETWHRQGDVPSDAVAPWLSPARLSTPLSDGCDRSSRAERARLAKEMAKCDADIARVDAKLGNPNFVARAPEDVVEEEKEKRDEAQARKSKIAEALERLKGAA